MIHNQLYCLPYIVEVLNLAHDFTRLQDMRQFVKVLCAITGVTLHDSLFWYPLQFTTLYELVYGDVEDFVKEKSGGR